MDIHETLATNMRFYRKKAHLTQEGLAERSGLHRTYIGGIEQTRVNVSLKNIGKIAEALDVDPALLFVDHEEGNPTSIDRQETARQLIEETNIPAEIAINGIAPSEYALIQWSPGGVEIRSLDVRYRDLTVQVLLYLIEQGYAGDELLDAYRNSANELYAFLQREA